MRLAAGSKKILRERNLSTGTSSGLKKRQIVYFGAQIYADETYLAVIMIRVESFLFDKVKRFCLNPNLSVFLFH